MMLSWQSRVHRYTLVLLWEAAFELPPIASFPLFLPQQEINLQALKLSDMSDVTFSHLACSLVWRRWWPWGIHEPERLRAKKGFRNVLQIEGRTQTEPHPSTRRLRISGDRMRVIMRYGKYGWGESCLTWKLCNTNRWQLQILAL